MRRAGDHCLFLARHNIRELENVIERGLILADEGTTLDIHHLFSADGSIESPEVMRLSDMVMQFNVIDSQKNKSPALGGAYKTFRQVVDSQK